MGSDTTPVLVPMPDLFPIMSIDRDHRNTLGDIRIHGSPFVVIGIPWAMIEPHEKQAQRNHSQSLKRPGRTWRPQCL